jgi:hypothetical protein
VRLGKSFASTTVFIVNFLQGPFVQFIVKNTDNEKSSISRNITVKNILRYFYLLKVAENLHLKVC